MRNFKIIYLLTLFLSQLLLPNLLNSYAKVDPPNYDFSLEAFQPFMPGSSLELIKKSNPKGELQSESGGFSIYKFYIAHIRYKFPIFVQFYDGKVVDFHARLPQYFLHDIFHQSLINRYKKQDKYLNSEEQSVYIWNNIQGNKMIYSGACTITCFPIDYSVISNKAVELSGFKAISNQLRPKK